MLNSSAKLFPNCMSHSIRFLSHLKTVKKSKLINLFDNTVANASTKQMYANASFPNRTFATSLVSKSQTDQSQTTQPVVKEVLTKKMVKTLVAEKGYFDTHGFISTLTLNGFTQQQAEVLCHLFKDIVNYISEDIKKECVTRPGQDLAIQQVMIHIGSLKKDMIILEKSEFSALRQENEVCNGKCFKKYCIFQKLIIVLILKETRHGVKITQGATKCRIV